MREFLSSLSFLLERFDVLEFQPKRIILSGSKCVQVKGRVAKNHPVQDAHWAKPGDTSG